MIVIAHRLSTIKDASRVVLDAGKIAALEPINTYE